MNKNKIELKPYITKLDIQLQFALLCALSKHNYELEYAENKVRLLMDSEILTPDLTKREMWCYLQGAINNISIKEETTND